ncbi:MAG: Xaa-Pro peptidase family protein [Planctomycetota bacterium]
MSNDDFRVDPAGCESRKQALLAEMNLRGVELAVLTRSESVQWLTGAYLGPLMAVGATLDAGGHVAVILPERKLELDCVADERIGYQAKRHSTMRNDMHRAVGQTLASHCGTLPEATAVEQSFAGGFIAAAERENFLDLEDAIVALRRHKYPDELRVMAHANQANRAMYEAARGLVQPGINELQLYSKLQAVAVEVLREPLTYFGQDFRSAARGGPPRDRVAAAGELCILDLGVGFRGYHTDNARTLAVGGAPTPLQLEAHAALCSVFEWIEQTVRPGVSCRGAFEHVEQMLQSAPGEFNHHLGHGVGLAPHEGPHLNPHWDEAFQVGDFFTVEPGLYSDELNAGLRLEQNYLVTDDGVELLTDWPLDF